MIYLDNAATSYPKPECVHTRVDEVLRKIGGNPGRGSHRMALEAGRVIFSTREALARLLNVPDASRLVFTKNATEAVNIALKGLLRRGDHVVTTSFEHNSVAKTLRRLEREGVSVTRVRGRRPDLVEACEIEEALTDSTRLVAVVHASNVFGTIQPVAEIAEVLRKRGVLLMVDGAQTVGALEVDLGSLGADVFVGTGHKALFGPQGTGFLYLAEGVEPEPLVDGGTGELDDLLEIPDRLEAGTMNTPGIGGLGAGVGFVLDEGVARIREHEVRLVRRIMDGLAGIGGISILGTPEPDERASLVTFNIDSIAPEEVGTRLDRDFAVMVRSGAHCAPSAHRMAGTYPKGAVRVSPGYFNTEDDIEAFLQAVASIAAG